MLRDIFESFRSYKFLGTHFIHFSLPTELGHVKRYTFLKHCLKDISWHLIFVVLFLVYCYWDLLE